MYLSVRASGSSSVRPTASVGADAQVWQHPWGEMQVYRDDGGWVVDIPDLATFRFARKGGVVAHPRIAARMDAVRDFFHRCIRPLVLQSRGAEVLHASAVATRRGIVGLCGESGSGKSTLAFGLGRRGYPLWADDIVPWRLHQDRIVAIPTSFSVRLRPPAARHFRISAPDADTVVSIVGFPRARTMRPLVALCVLEPMTNLREPTPGTTSLRAGEAFLALLAHAFCLSFQDPELKTAMIHNYLTLASRVPVYRLRFRAGLDHIEKVLTALERFLLRTLRA